MAKREGWRGRFFEDFEVGDVYEHPSGRTVTTTDNMWFTLLTQNTAPIHIDHAYAAATEFDRPLVDSTFTVALAPGRRHRDREDYGLQSGRQDGHHLLADRHGLQARPRTSRPPSHPRSMSSRPGHYPEVLRAGGTSEA